MGRGTGRRLPRDRNLRTRPTERQPFARSPRERGRCPRPGRQDEARAARRQGLSVSALSRPPGESGVKVLSFFSSAGPSLSRCTGWARCGLAWVGFLNEFCLHLETTSASSPTRGVARSRPCTVASRGPPFRPGEPSSGPPALWELSVCFLRKASCRPSAESSCWALSPLLAPPPRCPMRCSSAFSRPVLQSTPISSNLFRSRGRPFSLEC